MTRLNVARIVCDIAPRGWYCTRGEHDGPCALWPRWWNLRSRWSA